MHRSFSRKDDEREETAKKHTRGWYVTEPATMQTASLRLNPAGNGVAIGAATSSEVP